MREPYWLFRLRRRIALRVSLGRFGDLFAQPQFELADLWIGAYWKTERNNEWRRDEIYRIKVWICIVPCLPIYVSWTRFDEEVPF